MNEPMIFISYSHEDEIWKNKLVTHLQVLQQEGLDIWDDRRIGAGEDWYKEIQEAISAATVAILLISANFLTSKFIHTEEVPLLLERQNKEGLRIFPIIVRPCVWKQIKWLARMNLRPKDGRAVSGGNEHQIETDLATIAEEVATIIQRTSEDEDKKDSIPMSSKKPTKSDLLEDRFIKEMDKLVAPLNAKIGNNDFFLKGAPGYKDSRLTRHQEYFSFWDKINENKYLGPDYLHSAIDNYLQNKTDKVGDRTRDLSYEKVETELFRAIKKRYSELRSILNSKRYASTKEQFRFLCKNFYSQPINVRIKTAEQISELAKKIELEDVLDFWHSSLPGEKVGAAVAIGTHLTISDEIHGDKMIVNALRDGLSDSHSLVRYRVVEAIGTSEKLINRFRAELTDISIHDDNSSVSNKAKEVLKNITRINY